MVCERPLTLISLDVSTLLVSDYDAEHCSVSQFQFVYLAFLLLSLIYSKFVNVIKEKHLIQELHLLSSLSKVCIRPTNWYIQVVAELPLVPRICEATQQREWRSVKSSFDGAQPCSNIPSKQEEHHSELNSQAVPPVPALCQTPESSSAFPHPLCGDSLGWEMESTLPSGSSGGLQSDPEGNRISEGFYWIWTLSDKPS